MSKTKPLTKEEVAGMVMNPTAFGKALEARRVAAGLSSRELADEMGVNVGTVRRWEKGLTDPNALRILNWFLTLGGRETSGGGGEMGKGTTKNGGMGALMGEEMWRARAVLAEATLRDIARSIGEYRSADGLHAEARRVHQGRS